MHTFFTKYGLNTSNGVIDNELTLEYKDDAARVQWGGKWQIPTEENWQELIDYCTWTWTIINGIEGYKIRSNISGYSEKSIFLPTTGWRAKGLNPYGTFFGVYWANSLKPVKLDGKIDDLSWGSCLSLTEGTINIRGNHRAMGLPIRPVCP